MNRPRPLEPEHLDYYRDFEEIKLAFSEFLKKVPFYGRVILCWDERNLRELIPRIERPITTYGLSVGADLRASSLEFEGNQTSFKVQLKGETVGEISLSVPGKHNVKNALAAVAVGRVMGVSDADAARGLASFETSPMRMKRLSAGRLTILNDAYNCNPGSLRASLETLVALSGGRRTAVAVAVGVGVTVSVAVGVAVGVSVGVSLAAGSSVTWAASASGASERARRRRLRPPEVVWPPSFSSVMALARAA